MRLTADQAKFLQGTRAADARGLPLVLHHGTCHAFDRFERTKDLGFHFGTRHQAKRRLDTLTRAERQAATGPDRIVSVALQARNPVILPDDPSAWSASHVSNLFRRFLSREARAILRDIPLHLEEGQRESNAIVRAALLDAGHDAIVYRNQIESSVRSRGVEWSWVALKSDSILVLPEGTPSALTWPEDVSNDPGIDPDARLAAIGGLRFRNGHIAKAADKKAFIAKGREAIETALGRGLDWHSSWRPDDHTAKFEVAGRQAEISVMAWIGRLSLRVKAYTDDDLKALAIDRKGSEFDEWRASDPFREALASLEDPDVVAIHRDEASIHENWTPGETMDSAIDRFVASAVPLLETIPEHPRPACAAMP